MPSKVPKHIPLPGRDECPYCGDVAKLFQSSAHLYNGKDWGPVWECQCCHAYVGCHPGTNKALGRLANKDLRVWKMRAHAAFDPLWKYKRAQKRSGWKKARGTGYKWLAKQLGIEFDECHIGYFDIEKCKRVVEICQPHVEKLRNVS